MRLMRMQPAQFRIGALAKKVGVERFVIRFWEKEFGLKSTRSRGGQRFYTSKDLDTFNRIKTLLYDQKYTIEGAKRVLKQPKKYDVIGSYKTTMNNNNKEEVVQLKAKLRELRQQLSELRARL